MPFFLPAIVSLCSDLAILYLVYSNPSSVISDEGQLDETSGVGVGTCYQLQEYICMALGVHWWSYTEYSACTTNSHCHYHSDLSALKSYSFTFSFCVIGFIYRTQYAAPLAIIRLVLLVFPLPYHNYSGTAVKCPLFYELLYGTTLFVVIFQLLGIMIMDPESLSTIVPDIQRRMSDDPSVERTITNMAHTWWILCLNLLSNLLHIVLLWHVRSTAPANWTDRKHVLYFYTQQQQQRQDLHYNAENSDYAANGSITTTTARHTNGGVGNGEARTNGHGYNGEISLDQQQRRTHNHNNNTARTRDLLERMRCVPDGYDGKTFLLLFNTHNQALKRRH